MKRIFLFFLTNFGETTMIILVNCTHSSMRQDMIEGFTTAKDMAQRWGLTTRMVQLYCTEGAIPGAEKFGGIWVIPEGAEKPDDKRIKSGKYKDWRNMNHRQKLKRLEEYESSEKIKE